MSGDEANKSRKGSIEKEVDEAVEEAVEEATSAITNADADANIDDVDADVDTLPELEVVVVEAARPTIFSYRDGNGGTPFAIPDRKDTDSGKHTTAVHKVIAKAKRSSMAS